MSISLNQVTKYYGSQTAVDNISFEVGPGEIVGFLGPNGAGKSTTMKMITGYLRPDQGTIAVCGMVVRGEALAVKRKIGYLPELNPLYPEMYTREYLGLMAGLHQVVAPVARIEEVIGLTGLGLEANKTIQQLSKGYKQRVGLAAALLHDPEVLILDEPTTGLDPNQIIDIRALIRSLAKNKTILFSTHILQEVEALCNRVVVINKGSIVADDSIEQLRSGNTTAKVLVAFKEPIDRGLLNTLSGITQIDMVTPFEWALYTHDAGALSKELMSFTLQHTLNIVSLQTQTRSLEDIFRDLTVNAD